MPLRIVQSKQNARLKELRRALSRPARDAGALVGIEGPNLLEEALRAGLSVPAVFVAEEAQHLLNGIPLGAETEVLLVPGDILRPILETETPQALAALVDPPEWRWEHLLAAPGESALLVILAGVQDPGNLGTILRSAEAFGAYGLVSLPGTVSPWNGKALRASAGSAFRLPLVAASADECFRQLREAKVKVLTTAVENGSAVDSVDLTGPIALLIGNEGNGVPAEIAALADGAVTIPCPGPVESLNAAVAASVLLYEASRQRRETAAKETVAEEGRSMSLFDGEPEGPRTTLRTAPLAERMRPRTLEEYSGQEHLLGPGKPLRVQIERDDGGSMIFWGPPGVGKTTLAKIIAETTKATFIEFSAVMSGIKEIKQVMAAAAQAAEYHSRTILFVDEIHRFNKAQQDAFLPYVERGTIRLIGATTENPSFEIIAALLSRCRVYVLKPLSEERLVILLRRALEDKERGLGNLCLTADDEALALMAGYSSGDCRAAYNTLEVAAQLASAGAKHIDREIATEAVQQRVLMYDKSGEEHYNLISALHKSVRNSDPDAALYWLARMFAAGEDPMYLARRVVRMAVEDIGLAAPEALNLCLSAKEAMDFLGSPEGDLALAEAVVYLCLAPKSNAVYTAYGAVQTEIEHTRQEPVPLHLRNAPTRLMKELEYGKGYRYAHDEEGRVADMDCLPESLQGRVYYQPTKEGREKLLAQRMEEIRRIRAGKRGES